MRKSSRASRGSQYQLQRWVNDEQEALNEELRAQVHELSGSEISWLSPMEGDPNGEFFEYRDRAFLEVAGIDRLAGELSDFWPLRGPVWDGLATFDGGEGVLLVEAKAHVPELLGGRATRCRATSPRSISAITAALEETRLALGDVSPASAWMGPLYQTANRLAHLHFLRSRGLSRALFLHMLFVEDRTYRPTTREAFERGLHEVIGRLGLPARVNGVSHAFVPALF